MPRTYIIAEVGSNHGGDFLTAVRLIESAKQVGADAVKFQLFTPTGLAHPTHSAQPDLEKYALPREWVPLLAGIAKQIGIDFSATPCDFEAVDLLDSLNVPFIKIASGDLTYHALIRHTTKTGRHVILSTGMATEQEIYAALDCTIDIPGRNITLLHCVGAYPAEEGDANLGAIKSMQRFWPHIGYSDHTLSTTLPALAVAVGATIVEKHFTLDYVQQSPDTPHSLDPKGFVEMVYNIRATERAMGDGEKRPLPAEEPLRTIARRGLYYAKDMPAGHVLTESDLVAVRPAARLAPTNIALVVGRPLVEPVSAWAVVRRGDVA